MEKYNRLTPEEERIILYKGTETPFSGEYNDFFKEGTYTCRRCNAPLYRSSDKFDGHCGWPAFDDEIKNAVIRIPDKDGQRTEILCAQCKAHLGHVFTGEGFTDKNTRHCVNSLSMKFIPAPEEEKKEDFAVFASGCFWGTEYWFNRQKGIISTEVGYSGGDIANPSYKEVSSGRTGHVESVKVIYDPRIVSYEELVKFFFDTHDPTQKNGQGPDIGPQYLSVIFYKNDQEKSIAEEYISKLREKGYDIATRIEPYKAFYPEQEEYHQQYYEKNGKTPYCHFYQPK